MRGIKTLTIIVLVLGLVGDASASLVAHYELATNFNDSSGNSLHGVPMGEASILSDPDRGNVLSLNGAGQYVDCTNNALFNITNAITVACWIKVNAFDVEWQAVVAKGNSAWRLSRDGTQNELEFACSGLSGNWKVLGYKNINDGEWHHVAGVYDGSLISLYVDGVLDDSLAASGTIDTTTHQVWLGGNVERPGREWNGLLDDVRIYDHALSAAEIAGLTGKMGTAYTYQGRLLNSNKPADGSYDFEFKLYSDPGIGIQEGSTVEVNDLDVIDGYFTAELDFGSDVFSDDGLWLDISVRPGDSTGGFTTLSPRQAITPVPYALQTRGIFVDSIGKVGIGTTSPYAELHIASSDITTGLLFENLQATSMWSIGSSNMGVFTIGEGTESGAWTRFIIRPGGDTELVPAGGNVGIGTYLPVNKMDVEGAMAVGATYSGTNTAPTNGMIIEGNVGIGTTSPGGKLDVQGGNNTAIYATSSAGGGFAAVSADATAPNTYGIWSRSSYVGGRFESTGGTALEAYTDSGHAATFIGGNVGIGTTNPTEMLHINKTSGSLGLRVSSDAVSYQYMNFGATNGYSIGRASDDKFFINRDEPLGTGVLRILTVQSNGTVGIGTKTPTGRLHVETSTTNQFAVHGKSSTGAGVYGETAGLLYAGVQGKTTNTNNSAVFGENTATSTRGSLGGPDWGVSGYSPDGHGVKGQSDTGAGVYGETAGLSYAGVHGKTSNANNAGAFGENTATSTRGTLGGPTWGVKGFSTSGYGVYGESSTGYAGYFTGNVWVTGTMSAETVVDRTPYPKDVATAYQAVMSMERLPEGEYEELNKQHQLDHSRLDDFIRSKDGNRDLSATVSCHNEVLKDLISKQEQLSKAHTYIEQLHERIKTLEEKLVKMEGIICNVK